MRSLRVVTFNLWNDRPHVDERMAIAIEGLRALQPDVIGLQEVVDRPGGRNQAAEIARALDAHFVFDPVDAQRPAGALGNAIVSRYPIVASESGLLPSTAGDARRVLHALLATPLGTAPFFTCHLTWEMWASPQRERQVVALDEFVKAHPGDLPVVITGDFNASPDTDAIRFLTGRKALDGKGTYYRDAWARRRPHSEGLTWSDRNPFAVRWIERNRRLDYIFIGPIRDDGWGAVLDARVVLDLPGPNGLFASDHFGVYAEFGVAAAEVAV